MITSDNHCKNCQITGQGNFCSSCGQIYLVKRLTLSGLAHEVFHFFTHVDKGFLYTLKSLVQSPGKMQKDYVDGHRARHQKPFSMFFLCATIAALIYYWTNLVLMNYFNAGDSKEASFFHQYMVILQVVMAPVYSLIIYLTFYRSRYNYAETVILILYNLSLILIVSSLLQLIKLIVPDFETRYLELPIVALYNIWTNIKFYDQERKSVTFVKTIFSTALCFLVAGFVQGYLIDLLS
ncbi:MAG: DUF3667 domain-containing protein [Pedobacter sp.]|nr:DUF3667 domain-containing protein [Pedobacter sp.]MDQ8054067.1 DUF3667 domain-containing protein [Pedobacter sp.]